MQVDKKPLEQLIRRQPAEIPKAGSCEKGAVLRARGHK